ncbi:MAG: hypothetical protein R3308_05860 [Thiohalobacterales bacterium]|nr:hypothetical protein [Thiohalobacterales bacterium]
MVNRMLLAIVAVFITWSVLDFVIHGVMLASTYEATAELWRPMDEMNMPLMYAVTLVFTVCFVLIFALLVERRSLSSGILYGTLFGLATGVSMGYGSYTYMPIPLLLANSWFAGVVVESIVAGALAGLIMKTPDSA